MHLPEIHHCDFALWENTFYFRWKLYQVQEFSRKMVSDILANNYDIDATGDILKQSYLAVMPEWVLYYMNIPKQFLPYALVNEVLCESVTSSVEWDCAAALTQEIAMVPLDLRRSYLEWRKDFFSHIRHICTAGYESKNQEWQKKYADEMQLCVDLISEELEQYQQEIREAPNLRYFQLGDKIRDVLPTIKTALYPGCGDHAALKEMLPDAQRTYIDPDSSSMMKLIGKDPDAEFFIGKTQEYTPWDVWFDFAFLANTWDSNAVIQSLKPLLSHEWYVLADGDTWNFTAERLFRDPDYRLAGVFLEDGWSIEYTTCDLWDYLEESLWSTETSTGGILPWGWFHKSSSTRPSSYTTPQDLTARLFANRKQYKKYASFYLFQKQWS